MKIIVTGPRDFWTYDVVKAALDKFIGDRDWTFLCQDRCGVENVVKNYCEFRGIGYQIFDRTQKETYNMLGYADAALFIHDEYDMETNDLIGEARIAGLKIKEFKY